MQDFIEIAKTDFESAFGGSFFVPILLLCAGWILWKERDMGRKLLLGALPLLILFLYWCPLTGMLFIRILGEDIYWRLLWLILFAATVPYAGCMALKMLNGWKRNGVFLLFLVLLALGGKKVLSEEWFEPSANVYKIPQYAIDVCELLPSNVHVLASNRLTPYLRQCDITLTLEYARNALVYNGQDYNGQEEAHGTVVKLYKAVQESEIDVSTVGPLAKEEGCTFLVFSSSRTYLGDWEDYGYEYYGETGEFTVFADQAYEEGMDTRKWED